ncbi:DUF4334 domain-containing protein [Xanthobacter autotrophicus]|uniref:DUF4334 domain-containing protein n=1 Tax=Xanthobacter autotrophicus TaxID=280 RepID=UPI00372A4C19
MTFEDAIKAGKVTTDAAGAIFDGLAPTSVETLIGTWKGSEFPSGHPNDGLLAQSGWFGKRFRDADSVDPLLFYKADRTTFFAADPLKKFQASAAGVTDIASVQNEIETHEPTARLRMIEYRGKVTAAMIYDQAPIIDYFRKVDDDTLLGAMDRRGDKGTYFFVLRRV